MPGGKEPNIRPKSMLAGLGHFVSSAQYYNIKFAEWQQLLILPRIEVEVGCELAEKNYAVTIESVAHPSLVLTDAVLSTLAGMAASMHEEEPPPRAATPPGHAGEEGAAGGARAADSDKGLARIYNMTGLPLRFWPACFPTASTGDGSERSGSTAGSPSRHG